MDSSFNIEEDIDCHQEEKQKVGQKWTPASTSEKTSTFHHEQTRYRVNNVK
jgi:hypothetical protein